MPRPQRSGRSWWGAVAAAAAALVVVVAGAVAIRGVGGGGDGDDSASVATGRSESLDQTMAAAPSADSAGRASAATEQEADDAAEATTDGTSATAATSAGSDVSSTALAESGPVLDDRDALAAYASLVGDRSQGTAPDAATCTRPGDFVGPATYLDTPVEVFVDGDTATAVDATTCAVVEVVALTR
jgi:hypothetical protein